MPRSVVALVGRPNVGKSTLFNRILGRRLAIVEDQPGTTRDRIYAETEWAGVEFLIVDTGGLEIAPASGPGADWQPLAVASAPYIEAMRAQAEAAIHEADLIVFVVDTMSGITAADEMAADILRRTDKPIIIAANKSDNAELRHAAAEFYALGLGDPLPVSAVHGTGTGDLLDAVVAALPREQAPQEFDEAEVKLAIVGRPNVGKSSLLNRILGEERVIVSEIPGTTRDAIDTPVTIRGVPALLIDTAGIRRRGRIEKGLEYYSVLRALRAIERCDVALLVLDATQLVTAQDAHVAGYILDAHKSVVVAVNKWDLIEKGPHTADEFQALIRASLRFMDYVPIHFVSAKTGRGLNRLLDTALKVHQESQVRIPTGQLNRVIRLAMQRINPPSKRGRRLRVYYATQAEIAPPTIILFVNDRELVHFGFTRYIENRLREEYPFTGTPLRIEYRDEKERAE